MKQKPYRIHFVCRGNTFRSRLAAAYLATLLPERYKVSSSGVGTALTQARTSEAFTRAVAARHGLTHEIASPKTQTANPLLAAADIIIFMNKDVYDEAQRRFQVDARKTLIWHVPDISDAVRHHYDETQDMTEVVRKAEQAFQKIRRLCDDLQPYLTNGSWVDVVDKDDHPLGLRLPISWVSDRGYWFRAVRVIVQTSDGRYVVEKRSRNIVIAPGMLEVGVGGLMDDGELPLRAAQRETHEELGIATPAKAFRPLFKYRLTSYHPHYHKWTRAHIYAFAVTIPVSSYHLRVQDAEVAGAYLLNTRQLKHLLHAHRLQHAGRLKWEYKLFRLAVAYSTLAY